MQVGRLGRGPRERRRLARRCCAPSCRSRRAVEPAARKTASSRYVVVVLPFVPVTPTDRERLGGPPNTIGGHRPHRPADRRARATCGASTSSHRSTTRAPRPPSSAAAANACPSTWSPGDAEEQRRRARPRESYAGVADEDVGVARAPRRRRSAATSASAHRGKVAVHRLRAYPPRSGGSGSGQRVRRQRDGRARLDPEPLDRVPGDLLEQRAPPRRRRRRCRARRGSLRPRRAAARPAGTR